MSEGKARELFTTLSVALYDTAWHDGEADIQLIAAALRRAKAEGWREAADTHKDAFGKQCKYCLARAAQIEQGA